MYLIAGLVILTLVIFVHDLKRPTANFFLKKIPGTGNCLVVNAEFVDAWTFKGVRK